MKYARIKRGAICGIGTHFFNWPNFPAQYQASNFSEDMVFHIKQDNKAFECWANNYGAGTKGRVGQRGYGSIMVRGEENLISVPGFQHTRSCLSVGGGPSDDDCRCPAEHIQAENLRLGIIVPPQPVRWRLARTPERLATDPYATVQTVDDGGLTMRALREIFPGGEANAGNFVLFSVGGTFGTTATLEEVEAEFQKNGFTFDGLTFVVVQPRIVCLRYGRAYPENAEDFAFLKRLRVSSKEAMGRIGY